MLCDDRVALDASRAKQHETLTGFNPVDGKVYLEASAWPGPAVDANSRMSVLACLAHELAHADRYAAGYDRPTQLPDLLLDEAETSLGASFDPPLSPKDREDLVADARDRLNQWLGARHEERTG